jgi:hypothetical protein
MVDMSAMTEKCLDVMVHLPVRAALGVGARRWESARGAAGRRAALGSRGLQSLPDSTIEVGLGSRSERTKPRST